MHTFRAYIHTSVLVFYFMHTYNSGVTKSLFFKGQTFIYGGGGGARGRHRNDLLCTIKSNGGGGGAMGAWSPSPPSYATGIYLPPPHPKKTLLK